MLRAAGRAHAGRSARPRRSRRTSRISGSRSASSIDLAPDPALFADVDRDIRDDFVTESQLFVDSVFRDDRSVLDLLDGELHVS